MDDQRHQGWISRGYTQLSGRIPAGRQHFQRGYAKKSRTGRCNWQRGTHACDHRSSGKQIPQEQEITTKVTSQGCFKEPKDDTGVPYVNLQAQLGNAQNRHTYAHVNVVADRRVGRGLIKEAFNQSLDATQTRWVVETSPGKFAIKVDVRS